MTGRTGKHAAQALLPIVLAALFALLTLTVLLLSANVYRRATEEAMLAEQRYTALTYLQEKLRQAEGEGPVELRNIDGIDCLLLHSQHGGTEYVDCIFERDGKLMELFARSAAELPLAAAEPVLEGQQLTMQMLDEGLYRFTATDDAGRQASVILAEKSGHGN